MSELKSVLSAGVIGPTAARKDGKRQAVAQRPIRTLEVLRLLGHQMSWTRRLADRLAQERARAHDLLREDYAVVIDGLRTAVRTLDEHIAGTQRTDDQGPQAHAVRSPRLQHILGEEAETLRFL